MIARELIFHISRFIPHLIGQSEYVQVRSRTPASKVNVTLLFAISQRLCPRRWGDCLYICICHYFISTAPCSQSSHVIMHVSTGKLPRFNRALAFSDISQVKNCVLHLAWGEMIFKKNKISILLVKIMSRGQISKLRSNIYYSNLGSNNNCSVTCDTFVVIFKELFRITPKKYLHIQRVNSILFSSYSTDKKKKLLFREFLSPELLLWETDSQVDAFTIITIQPS